jgi:hypothetical protein
VKEIRSKLNTNLNTKRKEHNDEVEEIKSKLNTKIATIRDEKVAMESKLNTKIAKIRDEKVVMESKLNKELTAKSEKHIKEVKEIKSKLNTELANALYVNSIHNESDKCTDNSLPEFSKNDNNYNDNSFPPFSTKDNINDSPPEEKVGLNTKEVDKVKRTMEEITAYMTKTLLKFGFTSEAIEELVKSSFVQVGPSNPTLITVSSFCVPGEEARADTYNPCSQFQTQLLAEKISFIRLDVWQMINYACSGDMGRKNSLKKYLREDGVIMMGMIEDMLSPLVDKVDIVLFGQAAQSGSLPDLTEKKNILLHTQNYLVPNSCFNHINCKLGLYVFIQHILGLDPLSAFIHVNKAIDKTLLLASQGTVDDYPMRERQLAALDAVKPALEHIFPLPKKQ